MTLSRLLRIVPALLIVASPLVVPACAAATDSEAESLRGISGVYVLVENLSDEARRDGLNEQDIQTDVGLKLRLAGVKVLTEAEDF
jgi:hypothetical protein